MSVFKKYNRNVGNGPDIQGEQMKENNQQLMSATDRAAGHEGNTADKREPAAEPFGTFVALKRLNRLDVEAVRMQGCADGGAAAIEQGGK